MSNTINGTSSATSTTASAGTVANGRYWGLASGLDVDTIVTSLVADKQAQIDKANQSKQLLEWKQEAYQNIINSLNEFKDTYLSAAGSSSMLLSKAFVTASATSSSTAVTVTATAQAQAGEHTITVLQSAAAGKAEGQALKGAITAIQGTPWLSHDPVLAGAALAGTNFNITIDGLTKNISFNAGDDYTDVAALLEAKITAAFGIDKVDVQKVDIQANGDYLLSIRSGNGYNAVISVSAGTVSETERDALGVLGFAPGDSNRINLNASISSLFGSDFGADPVTGDFTVNINVKDITLNKNDSLSATLAKINMSGVVKAAYSSVSDSIILTTADMGASTAIDFSKTNPASSGFFTALFGGAPVMTGGSDAIFTIDGVNYTRNSNTFTIDGLMYAINKSILPTDPSVSSNISVSQDVSGAVQNITDFFSAYNKLIRALNTAVSTKPDNNYQPLTDAQKKEMKDTEIANWNNKIQSSILFNDPYINKLLSSVQYWLFQPVQTSSGESISLFQIGVQPSNDYTKAGEVSVDTDKLTAALQSDPEGVMSLFSQACKTQMYDIAGSAQSQNQRKTEEGIAYRLQDLINSATKTGIYPYVGSLVAAIGTQNDLTKNLSSILAQLKDINERITMYNQQMTDRKNQLYAQFTRLETFIQQMNVQSAMLSSFGSGSN